MSGAWIQFGKALREDVRVQRMARVLVARGDVTQMRYTVRAAVTLVLGGLAQLWMHADTFAGQDDVLEITVDEVDEIAGIEGFAKLLPPDWLKILDAQRVELPGFQAHNGTTAKSRALANRRVARFRARTGNASASPSVSKCNALASPDQTRPDHTRPDHTEKIVRRAARLASPPEFADFKSIYPKRAGGQEWPKALRAIHARLTDGATWSEILEGARRYAVYIRATGKEHTEYVKQAATFCGPDKHYLEPWVAPPTRAELRLVGNLDAADEAERRIFGEQP